LLLLLLFCVDLPLVLGFLNSLSSLNPLILKYLLIIPLCFHPFPLFVDLKKLQEQRRRFLVLLGNLIFKAFGKSCEILLLVDRIGDVLTVVFPHFA
jgi:hypothetical protein